VVRRLGGYTGDCLSAALQINKITTYLVLVSAWNSI
jgi:cobalamin synthase